MARIAMAVVIGTAGIVAAMGGTWLALPIAAVIVAGLLWEEVACRE